MMKHLISTLFFLASTLVLWSQAECEPYIPMNVGSTWEMTGYDGKGKENGRISYELVDRTETESGVTFTIANTCYDTKNKETFTNSYQAYCEDGIFKFDMSFMLKGEQMKAFESMEITVDATEFPLPDLDASPGTKLPDGELKISAITDGPIAMAMSILVTDRLVGDRDKVETPAGNFDCLTMTQRTSTKMMVKFITTSKEWYAPNVGVVKSESYNKKGKLMGYSLLTKFNPA